MSLAVEEEGSASSRRSRNLGDEKDGNAAGGGGRRLNLFMEEI